MPSTCSCVLSRVMQIWLGHVERDLAQVVPVGDAVDERDHEVEAGLQHGVEAAQPLDDPGVLLRHHADRLHHDDQRDDEKHEGGDCRAGPHEAFSVGGCRGVAR